MSAQTPEGAEVIVPRDAEAARRAMASPGLNQFRRNPFRVLRLPAAATSKQAIWKAEKALSLTRAGMPLPGVDPIPWLPAPDELEIQQAVQAMEEPLSRLCEQLLWFDVAEDPMGPELRRALQGDDAEAILKLVEARDTEPPADPAGPAGRGDNEAIARRIHDANLRLLLAFSMLHEVGPGASTDVAVEDAGRRAEPPAFCEKDGLERIDGAHALFAPAPVSAAGACVRMLREALAGWGGIFGDARWGSYVGRQIARLDDELVSAEDAEALTNAVAARVVDLVAGELKLVLIAGRTDQALDIVHAAAESGVAPSVWLKAFRPLRYVLRAELDEIAGLISTDASANLRDVKIYVARLQVLGGRWKGLDRAGLLGLAPLVDEGVTLAFERLCSIYRAASPTERVALHERVLALLSSVGAVARSASLRERIKAFLEDIREVRNTVCHFCRKREPSPYPTVVVGTSVTRREQTLTGVRVHYRATRALVPRCERCADLHDFINKCSFAPGALLSLYWLVLVCAVYRDVAVAFAACILAVVPFLAINAITGRIAIRVVTPRGERRPEDVAGSAGHDEVKYEESITVLTAKVALALESRK